MQSHEMLTVRDELSKYWHGQTSVWIKLPHCGFLTGDRYSAFCVAKDWLQDTGEALLVHRRQGFSPDPHQGYIEFWGILQATFVQQDALAELHYAVTGCKVKTLGGPAWKTMRDLRNLAVGHPTRKDRPTPQLLRCVAGRQTMSYDSISVMIEIDGTRSHTTINLGQRLDEYDGEAAAILRDLFAQLRTLVPSAP